MTSGSPAKDQTSSKRWLGESEAVKTRSKDESRYRSLFEESPLSLWEEDYTDVKKHLDGLRKKGVRGFRAYFRNHPEEVRRCASLVKVVDVNKATLDFYDIGSKKEFFERLEGIFTPESCKAFEDQLVALTEGKTAFEGEDITQTTDGRKKHVRMKWIVPHGYEKTLSRVFVALSDITKQRGIDEKLNKAFEELKILDELKSNIISNVSHELRTPITIARSAIQLLRDEDDSETRSQLLEMALNAFTRQNMIIEDLIQTARLVVKKKELKLGRVDIGLVIELVTSEFEPLIVKNKLKLDIEIADDLPRIRADEKRLSHVIRNLVSNAVKFNKPGGRIEVVAVKKGEMVEIAVSDTGVGIDIEQVPRVFDSFYQGDGSIQRHYGGTGMGLSTAELIVELHGGRISVESIEGKGSTFRVKLPINQLDPTV